MIKINSFTFNAFQENTYVVSDETGEAVIIDPGCYSNKEKQELDRYLEEAKLKLVCLLNTHCHIDHVLGNDYVIEKYQVPLLIHANDLPVLQAVKTYAPNYGFPLYREATPTRFIGEGEKISFGNSFFSTLFLPGHAPGHVGYYLESKKVIFSGDVLFKRSVGRTDLPGGDFNTLLKSIHQKLFLLPNDVIVYSGHGDSTTIGEEKESNPFCGLNL